MKKTTILLWCIVLTKILFSQQIKVTRDFGVWTGFNIEKKLSSDFVINLEQQLRLYENATKLDDYILDFGGKFSMNKNFNLGANLRYIYDVKRWKNAENNYRYNLDLSYKGKISTNLKLYYRLRYQREFVDLFDDFQTTNKYHSGIRNKLKLKTDINNKNKLYVSGELFRLIETFREPYFNMIRFYLGDEIETKVGNLDCSLGYEKEINSNNNSSFFFIKIIYTIKL